MRNSARTCGETVQEGSGGGLAVDESMVGVVRTVRTDLSFVRAPRIDEGIPKCSPSDIVTP